MGPSFSLLGCAVLFGTQDPSALSARSRADPQRRPEIAAAVERGLGYLADQQTEVGCWTGDVGHKQRDGYVLFDTRRRQRQGGQGHVGVTAVAGLAFLADGHLPEHGPYGSTLGKTIDYLLGRQTEFGYITDSGTRMYSHAFATLFLSQVHGMAGQRQAAVERGLVAAVDFIERTQNQFGAWRYSPFTVEADLSVTVCQVQALRAARNAGIHVSSEVIARVVEYLEASRIDDGELAGAFYYKIYGRAARSKTSFTINAAAVTSLHSAGLYDEARYGTAIDYVVFQYPEISANYPDHYFFWYGNYYASQALYGSGGPRWQRYFARLSADLLRRQRPDGSWPNSVGPGEDFGTAMACLLLRVPAQYLPIFQK